MFKKHPRHIAEKIELEKIEAQERNMPGDCTCGSTCELCALPPLSGQIRG